MKSAFSQVSAQLELNHPADVVWGLIGDFNNLPAWHPEVHDSELEEGGRIRKLVVAGGEVVRERLERHDPVSREYEYVLIETGLPVRDCRARVRVTRMGAGRCRVEWSSRFAPFGVSEERASAVILRIYQLGLEHLRRVLQNDR